MKKIYILLLGFILVTGCSKSNGNVVYKITIKDNDQKVTEEIFANIIHGTSDSKIYYYGTDDAQHIVSIPFGYGYSIDQVK